MRNGLSLFLMIAALPAAAQDEFASLVRPVLVETCSACHAAEKPDNKRPFLRAMTAADVSRERGLWRGVALQLRNRTMPPSGPQPSEADRFRIATCSALTTRSLKYFRPMERVARGLIRTARPYFCRRC